MIAALFELKISQIVFNFQVNKQTDKKTNRQTNNQRPVACDDDKQA